MSACYGARCVGGGRGRWLARSTRWAQACACLALAALLEIYGSAPATAASVRSGSFQADGAHASVGSAAHSRTQGRGNAKNGGLRAGRFKAGKTGTPDQRGAATKNGGLRHAPPDDTNQAETHGAIAPETSHGIFARPAATKSPSPLALPLPKLPPKSTSPGRPEAGLRNAIGLSVARPDPALPHAGVPTQTALRTPGAASNPTTVNAGFGRTDGTPVKVAPLPQPGVPHAAASGSINGTSFTRPNSRALAIGGPPKAVAGISGSMIRLKH